MWTEEVVEYVTERSEEIDKNEDDVMLGVMWMQLLAQLRPVPVRNYLIPATKHLSPVN